MEDQVGEIGHINCMGKTLQNIQDFYKRLGYSGDGLREVLEKDKEYKSILKEKRSKLIKRLNLSKSEKRNYVMSTDHDFEIILKIRKLEKLGLSKNDAEFIKFIRTQLELNWSRPLIKKLDSLLKKYKR